MADEAEAPDVVVQDTPEIADETPAFDETASEAPEQQDTDWEKRYNDLRPQWDRTKQQLQTIEPYLPLISALSDETTAESAIRALYQEYIGEDNEDTNEYEDPGEKALRLLQEQQAQQKAELEAQARRQQETNLVVSEIDSIAAEENRKFSEDAENLLFALATHPDLRGEKGQPDTRAAYKVLKDFEKQVRDSYVESKKAPRIPSGRQGERAIDLSNDEERVNYLAQIIEAESQ